MVLTEDQRRRYSRNTMLEGIGGDGQRLLLSSHAAVVGCGALGSLVSMYLAGSGVGKLAIIAFDTLELRHLHPQLSITTSP